MPTLDDLPTLAAISGLSSDDLFPIYDLTATGSSKVRKVALDTITGLSSVQTVSVADSASAKAITATSPLVFINGAFTSTSVAGVATVTLPDPTGTLRDVAISSGFSSFGTATLVVATPTAGTLFTFASASGVTSVSGYSTNNIVRFRSNGTNWYRVH
jgi:hypothetical protein